MSDQPPVNIPRVARITGRTRMAPYVIGFGVLGTVVFASLASGRNDREEVSSALPPLKATTVSAPVPPPLVVATETKPFVAVPMTSAQPSPPPSAQVRPQQLLRRPRPRGRRVPLQNARGLVFPLQP
jgi:hypothetical protein